MRVRVVVSLVGAVPAALVATPPRGVTACRAAGRLDPVPFAVALDARCDLSTPLHLQETGSTTTPAFDPSRGVAAAAEAR